MYSTITVAVDNSPASARAEELAVAFARATGSALTGLHAYTGRFHRGRFQALEPHLPGQYQDPAALAYQRGTHSVLIDRGLELISSEYLKRLRDRCGTDGIPFREMIVDGKNADVIIGASRQAGLMVMGDTGLGSTAGTPGLGSNTRRMLRHGYCDLLVARTDSPVRNILAGIDGSGDALSMVGTAAGLARTLGANLRIAASFDPGFHQAVFGSLSGVLSPPAGEVFRFSAQKALHNEIIDTSLGRLYTGYLDQAAAAAREQGADPKTILLRGKPAPAVCAEAAAVAADLIVVARHGMHRGAYGDIGSNAERIAEQAGTSVLVVGGKSTSPGEPGIPQLAAAREPLASTLLWTDEARRRLDRVPVFARPMAALAIERFAQENRETVITPEIMTRAKERMGQ